MPELANRVANENRLQAAILSLFRDDPEAYLRADFPSKLRDALAGELGATYLEAYLQLADEISYVVPLEGTARRAERWAARYSTALAKDIAKGMRKRFTAADEKDDGFLIGHALAGAAIVIAATEITRAITRGERDLSKKVNRSGAGTLVGYWFTERDGKVCKECQSLDGKPERYWRHRYAAGPPIHPVCRCWIRWVWSPSTEAL